MEVETTVHHPAEGTCEGAVATGSTSLSAAELMGEEDAAIDCAPEADDGSGDDSAADDARDTELPSATAADDDAAERAKRIRVAIIFGYVGTNYQGLQKNPGAHTVEEEVEKALLAAGGITAEEFGDLQGIGWNRAARTDKGVHAAGQVVSARVILPAGGEDELRERLQTHLPPDIRCIDMLRVINHFNAKNQCSSRQYEYLLPTFTLAQIAPPKYIAKYAPMSQAEKLAAKAFPRRVVSDAELAADPFVNGIALTAGRREWGSAGSTGDASIAHRHAYAAPGASGATHTAAPTPPAAGATASATPAKVSSNPPDAYQTGEAGDIARRQEWDATAAQHACERAGGFRLSDSAYTKLNGLVARYIGTKAYHNFTPRMTFGDASTVRYISDCRVSRPFVVGSGEDAMEYVRVTLVGQSFLYNQIRHMVGLVVDIVRGAAPANLIDVAFSHGVVKLPLAPAEGLYLSHCNFMAYDKKFATPPLRSLTYLGAGGAARAKDFKELTVWTHIHASVTRDRPFHKYMAELAQAPMKYKVHVPYHLAQVLQYSGMYSAGRPVNVNKFTAGAKRPRPEEPAAPSSSLSATSTVAAPTSSAGAGATDDASAGIECGEEGIAAESAAKRMRSDGERVASVAPASSDVAASSSSSAIIAASSSAADTTTSAAARAAVGKPKMFFPSSEAERDEESMSGFTLDHIVELLLMPANPKIFSGLNISKVAREKSEFKQKLRAGMTEAGLRGATGGRDDDDGDDAMEGGGGSGGAGDGNSRSSRGGGRGRGGRGGRGGGDRGGRGGRGGGRVQQPWWQKRKEKQAQR